MLQLTKHVKFQLTFFGMTHTDLNRFYLRKYSHELQPFPVLNKADMLTWPSILKLLGCQ